MTLCVLSGFARNIVRGRVSRTDAKAAKNVVMNLPPPCCRCNVEQID